MLALFPVLSGCGQGGATDRAAPEDNVDTGTTDTARQDATSMETIGESDARSEGGADGTTGRFSDGAGYEIGNCGEPTNCPRPDNEKRYDITCLSQENVSAGQQVEIHAYGRYLTDETRSDGDVKVVQSRDVHRGGATGNGEAVSDCHVVFDVNTTAYGAGESFEVSLVRSGEAGGEIMGFRVE